MPLSRPALLRPAVKALLLAASGAALIAAMPASAQEPGLRGEVAETQIRRDLLSRPTLAARRSPLDPAPQPQPPTDQPYRPQSQGAVQEENPLTPEEAGTLFADPRPVDGFADAPDVSRTSVRRRQEDAPPVTEASEPVKEEQPAQERQQRVDSDDEERNIRVEPDNQRTASLDGLEPDEETESPFAPPGIRVGNFIVRPTLETGITWTSNANYSPTPAEAFLSESTLRLNAVSDWSRHSATINAFGTYRKTISGTEVSEPSGGIDGTLNVDISESLRGIATLGYQLRPEAPDSPVPLPPTTSRPLRHTLTGSAGLEKDLGKLRFSLIGEVERLMYEDADLLGGGTLSQEERNSTLATATLRTGYAVSPALTPFVELEYGRRFYDLAVDTAGYRRSSDRLAARGGIELDLGEKVRGEFALGWVRESFDDTRLVPIDGLSAIADLSWSPQRGTTVNLNAETTVEGTTVAGESGSLLYAGTVSVSRELRADLTGDLAAGIAYRDYAGSSDSDLTLRGQASLTWWMNRYAGITSRYSYETLTSTLPGRDTETHSVYLGLRLQR